MHRRVLLLGIAGLLAALGALLSPGAPSLGVRIAGSVFPKTQSPAENGLPASLCITGNDAPALREWVSQHPKSKRGRLDHQRLRLHGAAAASD